MANGSIELDAQDLELLSQIENDFDRNLEQLAEEMDLSKSAIHYRLQKYRNNGILEKTKAKLNPESFGLDMVIITEVYVSHQEDYITEVGERLTEIPGVNQVYYTLGDVDFMTLSRGQNREQINEILSQIVTLDAIEKTSSRFVMKEIKTSNDFLQNLPAEARESLIND